MYQFPADELQLFLAKKGDTEEGEAKEDDAKQYYAWLPSSTEDVKKLKEGKKTALIEALTEEDKELQAEDPLEDALSGMDPSLPRQIHVLVVTPEREKTSSPLADVAITLFQHTFLNVPSTTASRTQKLKKQLVEKYYCDCGTNQDGDSILLCMLMKIGLPSTVVIASHIFRREHDRLKSRFVQIADIDDVRNGLLLFKPIESAFDDLDIAFLVDKEDQFTLKLFNPDIKSKLLVDSLTQKQWDALGGESVPTDWETSTSPVYAPYAPEFNVLTTFGELDGKPLWFPSGSTLRPFRRCLYHQAQLARAKAIIQGWVSEDYNFDDFSSEAFTLEEKMKLLFTSSLLISESPS